MDWLPTNMPNMAASGAAEICETVQDPLAVKLEYVILSVMSYHHGCYEDSLHNWLLSLKLAFPQIENSDCIRGVLTEMWRQGLIELRKPSAGHYFGDDAGFFSTGSFEVRLTPQGNRRLPSKRSACS